MWEMGDGWCTAAIHVFTRPDGWHAGVWLSSWTLQAGYFEDAPETRSALGQITMYTMALFCGTNLDLFSSAI